MKFFGALICLIVAVVYAQVQQPTPTNRKLPADVLRDFPGACFASTQCRLYQVGQQWSLAPFCGIATCLLENGRFIEQVQDCGLLPKQNDKCRVTNEKDRNATYPTCCPVFECQPGVQLVYPTPEELAAQAAAAAAQAQANQG